MKHFGIAQWVDFARGLVPPERRGEMQDHLAGGCAHCQGLMDFCAKLAHACLRISTAVVPDEAVRSARAIFPVRPPQRPRRALRIPVELIYDSFLVPSPAGLRSTWQVGWQGLFHAGDCSVDLRVEPELRSSKASVVGQISNHVLPGTEMSDIPVYLKAGKLVVAETRSNRFGEFQMEYEQQGRLQLCIYLDGGSKCIQVPLKKLAADKPASNVRLNQAGDRKPRGDVPL
ncbi:MAG TPA: hypothetical protein VME43_23105 [Bryobacteraceae bacterium]|nr:hypothetical protein [Bryobacteraceae bacterium]